MVATDDVIQVPGLSNWGGSEEQFLIGPIENLKNLYRSNKVTCVWPCNESEHLNELYVESRTPLVSHTSLLMAKNKGYREVDLS